MAGKRASNGLGSLRKIVRSGKKYFEYRFTDPLTHKQRSVSASTEAEAVRKAQAILAAISSGSYVAPSRMTVVDWLAEWCSAYTASVTPGTRKGYADSFRLHVIPAIGRLQLSQLTPAAYQGFLNALADKQLSPKTIRNVHGCTHSALQQAVKNGLLARNPADDPVLQRVERADIHPLEGQQIDDFLAICEGNRFRDLFYILLYSGMRLSEALGLQWNCISFPKGTINIKQQLLIKRGTGTERTLADPKHHKKRTIQPPESVMETLKQIRKSSSCINPSGYVFADALGQPFAHASVEHQFKKLVTAIGLPDRRPHDLRHTFATESLRLGVDPKTVSAYLGHASVAFTLDVYGHCTDQMQQAAANKLQAEIQRRKWNA